MSSSRTNPADKRGGSVILPIKTPRLVNLAEVAKALEQIKAVAEEQADDELFVFDKHGNKVLL